MTRNMFSLRSSLRGLFVSLLVSFFLLLSMPSYADEIGEILVKEILANPSSKLSNKTKLLITRDLQWYGKNMDRLPQTVQDQVQAFRIHVVGDVTKSAAELMGEEGERFFASGSCAPSRDIDLLYVGKNKKRAEESVERAINKITEDILADSGSDPYLQKIIDLKIEIPEKLDSKIMDVVTSDLPDFGYLDMNNAITKARAAMKAGEPNAIINLNNDLLGSLQKNLDAQVKSMGKDMYRGAPGQRFFALNYLGNPEKVRRFVQDSSGTWGLKSGGMKVLSESLQQQVEAIMPTSERAKFAKVASDYTMYFKHGAEGADISGTAKYVDRIWADVDATALLSYMDEDETRAILAARRIAKDPNNASVILAGMKLRESDVVEGVKRAMHQTVENQLLLNVNSLLTELEQVGAAKAAGKISDIEEIARKHALKFDLNDLANGLSAMSEVPEGNVKKILKNLHAEFGKRDMGKHVLGYIEKQLELFTGESANLINLRIIKTLMVKGEIPTDEYFEIKRLIQEGKELPDGFSTGKLKRARQEILFLTSVDMLEVGGGEQSLNSVVEQWRSQRRKALITTVTDEVSQTVQELKTLPVDELKKLGWLEIELKLPIETKLRLKLLPGQMADVAERMQRRLGKQAISLMQWQKKTREYIFSLTPTEFGEAGDLGPMDAVFSVATGLFQTYTILNSDKPMTPEQENLALANAWVTAMPIVGDFAEGILAGIEAGFTGNKRKALEAGLYVSIGAMAVVPGGQIPAMITGMIMAGAPIAEGVYDARQAQNLIQTWIISGNWEGGGDQPMKLVGLFDRSHVYHELTYEDLLTKNGDVPYESEKADGLFSTPTINGSIRAYAEKYVFPQYPKIKEYRESLKHMFPLFNDKDWANEADAKFYVTVHGGKAALLIFSRYYKIRTQALNQTIKQLKLWAEEEFKVSHDYDAEVEKIKVSLRALQTELKVSNLVAHADSSANAYSKVIKNKMEQETLPLSRYRIYKHYLEQYNKIAVLVRQINGYWSEVPEGYKPSKMFLTGYPEFDRPRITKLASMIKNGRAHAISQVEHLIKQFGFKAESGFDPKNTCHQKPLSILLGHRYKVAFIENLVGYYTTLAEADSVWSDAYDAAKARYTQVRDNYAHIKNINQNDVANNAMANALITFVAAMPYSLASGEREFYRETASKFRIKMKTAMRKYEMAAFLTGEAGRALESCLKADLKVEISLSPLNPVKGKKTRAKATLKAGTLPSEYYWTWKAEGDVKLESRIGAEIEATVNGPGKLTAIMLDDFRNTAKVLAENTMKVIPSQAEEDEGEDQDKDTKDKKETTEEAGITATLKGPGKIVEVGSKVNLTASVGGGSGPYVYEWDGVSSNSATASFTASHVGDWTISLTVVDRVGNTAEAVTVVRVSPGKIKIKGVEGDVAFGSQTTLNAHGMGLEEQDIDLGPIGPICTGDGDNPFCVSTDNDSVIRPRAPIAGVDYDPKREAYIPPLDSEDDAPPVPVEEHKVVWHSEPPLTFDPTEGPEPITKITYDRMGEVKIWCELLKFIEGSYQTIGECEQVTVNVVAPELKIGFQPANGKAHVGQKVTATIYSKPAVPNKLIDYRWLDPATSNRLELDGNGRRIMFTVQDTNPVKLKVLARVPVHGDDVGEIESSFTGVAYGVNAWAVQPPNLPRTWDPVAKGLKTIPRGSRTTHERITLKAKLVGGEAPEGLRWNWTVNNGTSISNPASQTPTVTRSSAGTISARVTAKNSKGHKLGEASVTLEVIEVVSPPANYKKPEPKLKNPKQKKDAAKKMVDQAYDDLARGDINAAEKSINKAKRFDPKSAAPAIKKIAKAAKKSGWRAVNRRDFSKAKENLQVADRLNPGNKDTQEKLKKLKTYEKLWSRAKTKVPLFDQHVAEKKPFSAQKVLLEMQKIQSPIPGGGSSPLLQRISDDFNAVFREYRAYILDLEQQNTKLFKEKNWQGVLDILLPALNRELSENRRKNIQGSIDLARQMMAEEQQKNGNKQSKGSSNIGAKETAKSDEISLAKDPSQPLKDIDKLLANPNTAPPELRSVEVPAPKNEPQKISSSGYRLALDKTIYAPNESVKLSFTTPAKIPRNTWVGLIPSHVAHGSEKQNNQHDTTYQMVYNKQAGDMVFTAPRKAGTYDLRMNTPEGDRELISITFTVGVPQHAAILLLQKKVFAPNEKITLGFKATKLLPNNTWVGLLPADIKHGSTKLNDLHDKTYQNLYQKESGKLVFTAPKQVGSYDFRMNETSNDKELASVGFEVAVPAIGNELLLPKKVFAPNEKIHLEFKASKLLPNNSWIGLLPANVEHGSTKGNDQYDMTYQTVYGKESGKMVFIAPNKVGKYDFRMNETTNDKELVAVDFEVAVPMEGNEISLNKKIYAPNEKIDLSFKASALLPQNTWIGLIPSDVAHGSTSHNDKHDLTFQRVYGKTDAKLVFKAPTKVGEYSFRMNETTNDKEVATIDFKVAVPSKGNVLTLAKTTFTQGETIKLNFKASTLLPQNTWVGLIPANIDHGSTAHNDKHDLTYQRVYGKASGQMVFVAPRKPGKYTFRMSETTNDKEVAYVTFTVVAK